MNKKGMIWFLLITVAIAGVVLWGPLMSRVEQANYTVFKADDSVEIRDYPAMLVAETKAEGGRLEAVESGFKRLADYIFGHNIAKAEPSQGTKTDLSQKIAMTAPVFQQANEDSWTIRFVMPSEFSLETLPKPKDPLVIIRELPAGRFAVIRFSGLADDETLAEQTERLNDYIEANDLKVVSMPVYAFYDHPWTLPLMRRNEVLVQVRK